MQQDDVFCPNCHTPIKEGFFGSNNLFNPADILIINEFHEKKTEGYCGKCGPELRKQAIQCLSEEKILLVVEVARLAEAIPAFSISNPENWKIRPLGLVTGQSSSQAGVFQEIASSETVFFGHDAQKFNKKIKAAENRCLAQMRRATMDLGGNAMVGVHFQSQMVGGEKGSLFISMSGTAVLVENLGEVDKLRKEVFEILESKNKRLNFLITLLSGKQGSIAKDPLD
jgi:uncharacterized protein YbjQ (UPF0145 family)